MSKDNNAPIWVQDLGKHFPDSSLPEGVRWIFRGITFEVGEFASLAIVGPSGDGKSVLLKTLARLLSPDQGTVHIDTKNLGMLFQKNALFDSLTCEENLLFPLKERLGIEGAKAKETAAWFLTQVGLKDSLHLYPDEISGGMQKRLGIARALVLKPKVLLYDEPTAGLDPITSKKIAELIRELQHEVKGTVITVTNDMQRAYQLGDRIALMAQGRLQEGGTPAQVQATTDPALRQFIYGLKEGPLGLTSS